jgi:hypothetical protein
VAAEGAIASATMKFDGLAGVRRAQDGGWKEAARQQDRLSGTRHFYSCMAREVTLPLHMLVVTRRAEFTARNALISCARSTLADGSADGLKTKCT